MNLPISQICHFGHSNALNRLQHNKAVSLCRWLVACKSIDPARINAWSMPGVWSTVTKLAWLKSLTWHSCQGFYSQQQVRWSPQEATNTLGCSQWKPLQSLLPVKGRAQLATAWRAARQCANPTTLISRDKRAYIWLSILLVKKKKLPEASSTLADCVRRHIVFAHP